MQPRNSCPPQWAPFAAAPRRRRMESRFFDALRPFGASFVVSLMLLVGLAQAQATNCEIPGYLRVEVADDIVTAKACDVPVKDVLDEIAHQSGLIVVSHDPLDKRITITMDQVTLPEAVDRILGDQSFALRYIEPWSGAAYANAESSNKLWVFSQGAAISNVRRDSAEHSRRSYSDADIGSLSVDLAADDSKLRVRALTALATVDSDPGASALAAAALSDPDASVRAEAVYALGEIGDDAGVQLLGQALLDPDDQVREAAVEAFADIGGEASVRALAVALNDANPVLREGAVDALGEIGGQTAIYLLRQALTDEETNIREAAAEYLTELVLQDE